MKILNFISISITVLAITSCTRELVGLESDGQLRFIEFTREEHLYMDKLFNKNTIDCDEAMVHATDCILNQTKTRSENDFFVKLEVLTVDNTGVIPDSIALHLPDTLAYVFHSANNMCTLVPADNRISNSVLGVVNERDIYPYRYGDNDFTVRDIILEKLITYIYNEITKYEAEKDSMSQVILNKLFESSNIDITRGQSPKENEPDDIFVEILYGSYSPWEYVTGVEPLLNVAWDQRTPYDDFVQSRGTCDNGLYNRVSPGCGSIAAGMLMAYWQHPSTIHQYNQDWPINWEAITSGVNNTNATHFMYNTHVGSLIGMIAYDVVSSYGCESSTNVGLVMDWLDYVGYQSDSGSEYCYNSIVTSLNNSCPVLMFGYASEAGHAWLTDGYKEMRRSRHKYIHTINYTTHEETTVDAGLEYQTERFLNHNWGYKQQLSWLPDGCFDAYYYEPGYSQTFHDSNNYNNDVQIFTNIRPVTQ